jgi:periplasmic divalent cation tolerance protein
MKSCRNLFLVMVTAPDLKTARQLARAALDQRLAACVNLVPKLESHYWWKGKVESGNEVLMLLKTTRNKLGKLEKCILAAHPYDTAEFMVVPFAYGAERYTRWLIESC